MVTRTCQYCKKEFLTYHRPKKFCSWECNINFKGSIKKLEWQDRNFKRKYHSKLMRYKTVSEKTMRYILGEVYFKCLFEAFDSQRQVGEKDFVTWFRDLFKRKLIKNET